MEINKKAIHAPRLKENIADNIKIIANIAIYFLVGDKRNGRIIQRAKIES